MQPDATRVLLRRISLLLTVVNGFCAGFLLCDGRAPASATACVCVCVASLAMLVVDAGV